MPVSSSTKKVRLSLIGHTGKMGKAITALALADPTIEIVEQGEVVIDFSSPEGTKKAISMGKPLVCGTTGLTEEIFSQMHALSAQVPVLYSPNFSPGISLLFEMISAFKEKLTRYGSVSIEETHHTEKKDCPSGTAKKLGYLLGIDQIKAKRMENIAGIHQIKISLTNEELLIQHTAHNREAFASGALLAAKFLLAKPPKMYELSDIFIDYNPLQGA